MHGLSGRNSHSVQARHDPAAGCLYRARPPASVYCQQKEGEEKTLEQCLEQREAI